MTVRFPSGVSIQYNDACFADRSGNGFTDLYTSSKEPRRWVEQVLQNLEGLPNRTLRTLKRRLKRYVRGEWKP